LWIAVVIFRYFFVSGFPRLARVFTASLRGLSGLHVTQKPLIRFKPLSAIFHEATTSLERKLAGELKAERHIGHGVALSVGSVKYYTMYLNAESFFKGLLAV